ncbi:MULTISPECIES: TadE family type IV pilus minor pilin [unclassified Arthrobacter]|uniref:TadE family type IV pilus minor pilin n=1 Tax=unclassified Arthrobacter TaxID=235627 RepID=UPI0028115D96|nr:TadE family type IV pilus minor pilin [Arthrobacter sp. STN4]
MTAEFAVVLPAVTLLLALLLLGAGAGILQLRLEEGARAGARALARGESSAQAVDIASRATGGAGTVSVGRNGGYATVTLTGRMSGPLASMMPWQQSATASARMESDGSAARRAGTWLPCTAASGAAAPARTGTVTQADTQAVTQAVAVAAVPSRARTVPARAWAVPPRKTALWRWVHAPNAVAGLPGMVRVGDGPAACRPVPRGWGCGPLPAACAGGANHV